MYRKILIVMAIGIFGGSLLVSCQKLNPSNATCWDSQWLIGTWEGTTPSSITPFPGTKIRIVFHTAHLATEGTTPGGVQEVWAYDGTFTWDVDGTAWSKDFSAANYPDPDFNIIIWDCVTITQAHQTMNNISLRITDEEQTDPYHTINLDCGTLTNNTGKAPTQLDFYGDVQITVGESQSRADYPPNTGSMIRLKKK